MAQPGPSLLRPSLLDRLIGTPGSRRVSDGGLRPRELRRAVARDLEWLLNTRVVVDDLLASLPEASRSMLCWGLTDFSQLSFDSQANKRELASRIQTIIELFEPRLNSRSIGVDILERRGIDDFTMRFRIDALLDVDPIREQVAFDADMDSTNSVIRVNEGT